MPVRTDGFVPAFLLKKFFDFLHEKFARVENSAYICNPKGQVNAEIAQLVEHNLAKVGVASSSLVFRSKDKRIGLTNLLILLCCAPFRTSDPKVSPFQGVRGCQQKYARNTRAQRGFGSCFPLTIRGLVKPILLSFYAVRRFARATPKVPPPRGSGGVNRSTREIPARSVGSGLVFRSKERG